MAISDDLINNLNALIDERTAAKVAPVQARLDAVAVRLDLCVSRLDILQARVDALTAPPPPPPPPPVPPTLGLTFYVSPTGNDANSGVSPTLAKRTIAAAMASMRNGEPDHLLLQRGALFFESIRWKKSGKSAAEPMALGAYGTGPRPVLHTGISHGIEVAPGGGTPATIDCLTIRGLRFYAHTRDPAAPTWAGVNGGNGIRYVHQGHDLVVEDCEFSHYAIGPHFQAYGGMGTPIIERLTIRNCVIVDSYAPNATGTHSQGIYVDGVKGLVVENNVLDHCGWNEDPRVGDAGLPTAFNHAAYLQWTNGLDTIVRGNIFSRPASHALQLRSGGIIEGNLCVQNPIGLQAGYDGQNTNPPTTPVPNAKAVVRGNVVLEGVHNETPIPGDRGSGWGINFSALEQGAVVEDNIVAHCLTTAGNRRSIERETFATYNGNIIFDWTTPGLTPVLPETPGPWKDSTRSVTSYCGSLGLPPTHTEFYKRIRAQDPAFTAAKIIAYVKDGFTRV